jgi:hypothetical protein
MREARDWTSSVAGPSKRRKSWILLACAHAAAQDRTYPIAPYGSPHPCLQGVVGVGQCPPCRRLAHDSKESDSLHQCSEAEVRNLESQVRRLEAVGKGRCR